MYIHKSGIAVCAPTVQPGPEILPQSFETYSWLDMLAFHTRAGEKLQLQAKAYCVRHLSLWSGSALTPEKHDQAKALRIDSHVPVIDDSHVDSRLGVRSPL